MSQHFGQKYKAQLWAAAAAMLNQDQMQRRDETVSQPHCNPQLPKPMPFGPRTPNDVTKRQVLHRRVQKIVDRFASAYKVRGLSVAVSVSGELKTLNYFGTQDENLEVKTSANTVAPIGAISKLFLACLLYKLQEEGRVNLSKEASIQRQIPGTLHPIVARKLFSGQPTPKNVIHEMLDDPFHHPGHKVSSTQEFDFLEEEAKAEAVGKMVCTISPIKECHNVRNLLYHRSGMSGYQLYSRLNNQSRPEKSLKMAAHDIIKRPLTSFPGLMYFEENFSYELLAYLLEYAAGNSFEQEMSNFLLKLGLKNTYLNSPEELFPCKSRGSQIVPRDSELVPNDDFVKQRFLNATYVDYRNMIGSKGICSTVTDLDKMMNIFMAALLRSDDNSEPSSGAVMPDVRELTRMHENDSPKEINTSCGKIITSVGQAINLEYPVQLKSRDGSRAVLIHYQKGETMESSCVVMACSSVNLASLSCRPRSFERSRSKLRDLTLEDYSSEEEMLICPWEERSCHRFLTVSIICTDRQKNVYELAKAIVHAALHDYPELN